MWSEAMVLGGAQIISKAELTSWIPYFKAQDICEYGGGTCMQVEGIFNH
jgi:hypothetical protein